MSVAYGDRQRLSWSLDGISEGVFDCPHSTPKLTKRDPSSSAPRTSSLGSFVRPGSTRSGETYAERIARLTPSRGIFSTAVRDYFGIAARFQKTHKSVSASGWFSSGPTDDASIFVSFATG